LLRTFFFSIVAAPSALYALSLHDALPIFRDHGRDVAGALRIARRDDGGLRQIVLGARHEVVRAAERGDHLPEPLRGAAVGELRLDRKSTRLNSSHVKISYAVFCLKKKKTQ